MELEITIPSELSEVTLAQYQKYAKLNFDDNAESSFLIHKTIEAFCNLKLENIAKIKYSDARSIVKHINKLFEPKQELISTFKMHSVEFGFVPQLDDMTLGEYIDLDENFTDWENMHKAMAVLFRPVTQKKGERYTIEEYDSTKNIEVMKQMPLDVVMGAMFFFLQFKQRVVDNYPELFGNSSGEGTNYSAVGQFGKKWGWIQSIYSLAKGDVSKFGVVTKLNVHECLLFLAFEKEKIEIEKQQIKKQ